MTFEIIDITHSEEYEKHLYRCIALPYRKYRRREGYLRNAIPGGFHKKLVKRNGEVIGQIEYSPAEVSGLPIHGDGTFVMNCIWILRKAKGCRLGKTLLDEVIASLREENAEGLATIALEDYPSPWLKRGHMEMLGFSATESVELRIVHKERFRGRRFRAHLMWLPMRKNAKMPSWEPKELLKGVTFCVAHPLYHPEAIKSERIFQPVED